MLRGIIQFKSKTFLAFCFSFLLGVGTISIVDIQISYHHLYFSLFLFITLFIIFWKEPKSRFIVVLLFCFFLGLVRYVLAYPTDSSRHVSYYNGQKVSLVGYVRAEPDVRMDGVRYIVNIKNIQNKQNIKNDDFDLNGSVYIKGGLYPRYAYGDVLEMNCNLKQPGPIEDFQYDKYLARFGVFSICEPMSMVKVGEGEGSVFMRGILGLKDWFALKINLLWHEPYASFMAGLLYGYRGGLGSLNEQFSRTGVTHIVAISGYNITLIATIFIGICVNLYIPRRKAFWVVVTGIVLFVIFAGASASVVRAGIMGIIVLLTRQIGRLSRVGNVLVLTAVLMTLHNPFVLIYDAGFQLSFLSTLGLVYVAPLIRRWFVRVPEVLGMRETLISTFAAILSTLPLILFQFGRLSTVAPMVNVLILWALPFIMGIGFFAVIISAILQPLGQLIAWVAWAGMAYIVTVVRWFSDLSFAAIDLTVPVWGMMGLYGLLGYWIWQYQKGVKKKGVPVPIYMTGVSVSDAVEDKGVEY